MKMKMNTRKLKLITTNANPSLEDELLLLPLKKQKMASDWSGSLSFSSGALIPKFDFSAITEWLCKERRFIDAIKKSVKAYDLAGLCMWKKCPGIQVSLSSGYVHRVATKVGSGSHSVVIGTLTLPTNEVNSWQVKILKSEENDGSGICIGVAPSDINQNEYNYNKCGWYFDCYDSTLCSGPPHNYRYKEYGPRKRPGQYIRTGDSVGVVMDTAKGELSFVLNGVSLGDAYEGIPLDKPLVPCVILGKGGDSVELDTSSVKENLNSSILVPSSITTKSITWDSITLSWDAVEGASFYQIEVDESKFWYAPTTSTFTKKGLLPDTEHSFRVRAVCGNEVSEWSGLIKGRTQMESFEKSGWKEYPVYIYRSYYLSKKSCRKVTKRNDDSSFCTVIGNTALPLNKIVSWNVKVLKSKSNNGFGIFVGVASFDIDQNSDHNFEKCGWYFNCYSSSLCSGPPHCYRGEGHGPKMGDGKYVHTGDSVGVVMDTANGMLSFIVMSLNLGIAYKEIPLDKPLVPCVVLWFQGDSVELII